MPEKWPKVVYFMSSMGEKYLSDKEFPTFNGVFLPPLVERGAKLTPSNTYLIKVVTIINNKYKSVPLPIMTLTWVQDKLLGLTRKCPYQNESKLKTSLQV